MVVGEFAVEHAPQPTGLARRELKDTKVQLVVSNHVDEVAPANDTAGGAQVRRTATPGWLLDVQIAQLAKLEGREFLRRRALPLHTGSMPASVLAKTAPR